MAYMRGVVLALGILFLTGLIFVTLKNPIPTGAAAVIPHACITDEDCGSVGCQPARCHETKKQCYCAEKKPAYFRFVVLPARDSFVVALYDPEAIEQTRDILKGETTLHIQGEIKRKSIAYNPPWSFYLDPDSITFFTAAPSACDASIKFVEDNAYDFPEGAPWCPSQSVLVEEVNPKQQCQDGTLYGSCSYSKPAFCQFGKLLPACSLCGCPPGFLCGSDGNCK